MDAQSRKKEAAAAWIAAGRPCSGRLRDELTAAVISAAAEQRAAAVDAAPADLGRAARIIEQRQAAAAQAAEYQMAHRLFSAAQEWPRCGQDWPMDAAERRAQRLLSTGAGK